MQKKRGHRKIRSGIVVSDKMDRTVMVRVERLVKDPLTKKYVRSWKKFMAHDKDNQCGVGDLVQIIECRPLSRHKRWRVQKILQKAE